MNKKIADFKKGNLRIRIFNDRNEMGKASAHDTGDRIKFLLKEKNEIRIVFAAAPSQDEFLDELIKIQGIEWERITAFHMDEYIGLPDNAEQLFSRYLINKLFDKVKFKEVHLIKPADNPEREVKRYEALLKEKPVDIVCMGIGENGHVAFNDPPVADFNDPLLIKIVELDEACRNQQVNDGCFLSYNDVPQKAVTLTIPALMSGGYLSVVVPGIRKADAAYNTLYGELSTKCPASILRNHGDAVIYLDKDSSLRLFI
jgi:glucosamine-6-phosphate deaminase